MVDIFGERVYIIWFRCAFIKNFTLLYDKLLLFYIRASGVSVDKQKNQRLTNHDLFSVCEESYNLQSPWGSCFAYNRVETMASIQCYGSKEWMHIFLESNSAHKHPGSRRQPFLLLWGLVFTLKPGGNFTTIESIFLQELFLGCDKN